MPYLNLSAGTITTVTATRREYTAISFGGELLCYEDEYCIFHDASSATPWGWGWQHVIAGRLSSYRRPSAEYATLQEAQKALRDWAGPRFDPTTELTEERVMAEIA